MFYDSRRLPDMEVERRNQEVLAEQRRVSEERRLDAEANAKRQADDKKLAAEVERKALDDKKRTEEARIAADADAKKKAEEARIAALEAQRKADDDKRVAAEAETKKKADDARLAAVESQRKADDDKRVAEADVKKKAEEARMAALEAQRKADDDKRIADAAEAKKKADEARIAALEAQRKADDDKRVADADAKKKAEDARLAGLETQRKADEAKASAVALVNPAAAIVEPPRAVPQTQTAVLAPAITNSINPATNVGGPCDVPKAQTTPLIGGRMQVVIESNCRKGQAFNVKYGTHNFERKLDTSGRASLAIDLFLGKAEPVRIAYADGNGESLTPVAPDLGEVSKVALIWNSPVDLDLHAFENGAIPGKPGHLWSGAVSTAESAKAQMTDNGRGAGFLSTIDDGSHEGTKVEVYTFFHSAEQRNGVVSIALDYATRGATPSGEFCGSGAKAAVPYEAIALSPKGALVRERGVIAAAACGVQLTYASRFLRDAIPDLQFGP